MTREELADRLLDGRAVRGHSSGGTLRHALLLVIQTMRAELLAPRLLLCGPAFETRAKDALHSLLHGDGGEVILVVQPDLGANWYVSTL